MLFAAHLNIAQSVDIFESKCGADVNTHFEMKKSRENRETVSSPTESEKGSEISSLPEHHRDKRD